MLSTVFSAGLYGIDGFVVSVECNGMRRLPEFDLVGLPDLAVREAKERVKTACENSGFRFPTLDLMVNLAPADRKKEGSGFDCAILLGILNCGGYLRQEVTLSDKCFVGELSLSGQLRGIRGVLSMCSAAKEAGIKEFYAPSVNANEAAAVAGISVYAVPDMKTLVDHLNGTVRLSPIVCDREAIYAEDAVGGLDFSDVRGQAMAKRAMEIAAAGGHNILLIGPPGTGKSMLAKRLPTIMPQLTFDEAIETTKIHSVAGTLASGVSLITTRPFRSPHHTMSSVSLVGGGVIPRPGEISLAHNGVLFLDEFPEFPKQVSDALRQPLEDGRVTITRAAGRVTYPCAFMLVAAMNPCRCGYFGDPTHTCTCRPDEVKKYISRISGPLLDRIDIQVELPSIAFSELTSSSIPTESSATVRGRVMAARELSRRRMSGDSRVFCNAGLDSASLRKYCKVENDAYELLRTAYESLGLSARGYDRTLRVARTIADLGGKETIGAADVAEAIQFRSLDRKYWSKDK